MYYPTKVDIGSRIKKAREKKGLTQVAFGKLLYNKQTGGLGVSDTVVSRREDGNFDFDDLIEIAKALKIPAAWFLQEDDDEYKEDSPAQQPPVECDTVGDLIRLIEAVEKATRSAVHVQDHLAGDVYNSETGEYVYRMWFDISENLKKFLDEYLKLRNEVFQTIPKGLREKLLNTLKEEYSKTKLDTLPSPRSQSEKV